MIKEINKSDQKQFDQLANHPLQSWQWGEFRLLTGVGVSRLGSYTDDKLTKVFQITWHKIPYTNLTIGYCPKSLMPTVEEAQEIAKFAAQKGAFMIKWEPGVRMTKETKQEVIEICKQSKWQPGKPLFTKNTFWLDIAPDQDTILKGMNQKTRYNIKLATKKGVNIVIDSTEQGFEDYWKLTEETTKRQGFYAHTKKYHKQMWKTLIKQGTGHLLKAVHDGDVLVTWILFNLNGVLYYPYGASSTKKRELMSSNLMMWQAILLGKKLNCKMFDMWGSLGDNPDPKDPWFGFHRFKQGYGGELVEFIGTYDQVLSPTLYSIYQTSDWLRWKILKIVSSFRK